MPEDKRSEQMCPVLEVEFTIWNSAYPFVGVSKAEACMFELAEMVPRHDGRYAEFFNITGVNPNRIVDIAADNATVDVSLLTEYEHGGLFEFLVSGNCPAITLAELGALPREVQSVDGEGHIVAEVPPQYDSSVVIDAFLEENPDAELTAKREKDSITPLFSHSIFQQVLHTHLTDRQREVLQAAFDAGYYNWPRECTGKDIAEELNISSATFSEHIHAAERKLLTILFDGA
ncbi:bacterio-opsin activator domain-containing protein [Haladaptatus salinisoli]|uniref:helix-turn-helix domain-containing protein n=1 Tax=Haladaptatus salinisoli TaxID=2884876 RepID=UPI001D0A7086|nr:bacterio-opsin activator domain-containing protein [Haladaptatus salinisoli]